MDRLYRQMRVRHPSFEERDEGEVNNTREGLIPPQKTVSFKGEDVSRFQTHSSGEMSPVDDASNGEFAAAVAAAAYAISSLERGDEEEERRLTKKPLAERQPTLTKTRSKKEGSIAESTVEDGLRATLARTKSKTQASSADSGKISRWLSGKGEMEGGKSAGDISVTESEATKKKTPEDTTIRSQTKPGSAMVTVPSIKRTPTSTDKHPNDMGSKRIASEKDKTAGQNTLAAAKPTPSMMTNDHKLNSASHKKETIADAWEKAKIEKIRKRYEKLNSTILEWETEKKKRAKQHLDKKEGKLELRRKIASQEYRKEMATIDKMAGGARAAAEEKKRNDERMTMEKANEIRSTGKIPRACFCI